MRVEIAAVLFLLTVSLAAAALDQSYVHVVSRDGSSTMEKTMELAMFSNQLTPAVLERMGATCKSDRDLDCDVDVQNKKITIRERLSSGTYYVFTSEYGLPYITHTLVVKSIPSDRFGDVLNELLVAANVTGEGGSGVGAMDLTDKAANNESVFYLKLLKANITYTVTMPMAIAEARAGEVAGGIHGDVAEFNLVEVLEASEPITVRCVELNLGYIVAIVGIGIIAFLAFSFVSGRRAETPQNPKKGK